MTRIFQSNLGKIPYLRIIGHNPSILESWLKLEDQFLSYPTIDPDLFEQIRRVCAQDQQCRY